LYDGSAASSGYCFRNAWLTSIVQFTLLRKSHFWEGLAQNIQCVHLIAFVNSAKDVQSRRSLIQRGSHDLRGGPNCIVRRPFQSRRASQFLAECRSAISRGRKESFRAAGSGRNDAQRLLVPQSEVSSRQLYPSPCGRHFDRLKRLGLARELSCAPWPSCMQIIAGRLGYVV
jgi:hypothetical protein